MGESVKSSCIVKFALLIYISTTTASGQVTCSPTATTTQPLVCLVPFSNSHFDPQGSAGASASSSSTSTLPINGSIAAQLTQVPVPSGASGTITLQEAGNPAGHPFDDLGPVLTDRPETLGRRRLYTGFTYQHFNFNAIDGIGVSHLNFGFSSPPGGTTYYGSSAENVKFTLDQYVALLTYGVTKTTDLSLVVPVNSIAVSATPSNIVSYTYTASSNTYVRNNPENLSTVSGSARGVGDIKFGLKQLIYGAEGGSLAIATGLGFRIPTGDAYNFIGSGAYGVDIYGLVSYRSYKVPFSPHFKIGKLWNGPTPLLNPTGAGDVRLPGGMQFDAGTDIRLYKRKLTLGVDVIGSQFVNGQILKPIPIVLSPVPNASGIQATLPADQPVNGTYSTINLSSGLKYAPTSKLLIYGNILVQLNNVGLRSDPVPLAGISYNFHLGKSD